MPNMRVLTSGLIAFPLFLALGAATPARAEEPAGSSAKMTTPQTAEDHLAMAAEYDKKAKAAHDEAAAHRKMFADFEKNESPALKSKMGAEPPWVAKMRKHCDAYIRDAEAVAKDAEDFAKFHRMRAEELRGK
jgi:hypothetical protein